MYNEEITTKLKDKIINLKNDIQNIKINTIPDDYNTYISTDTKKNSNLNNASIELFETNPNKEIINIIDDTVSNITNVINNMANLNNDNNSSTNIDNDIYININGIPYFMLTQVGYKNSADNNMALKSYKYIFTDGDPGKSGNGTNLTGASCSMCAYLNCAINLLGIDGVTNSFNFQKNYFDNSTKSLNANLIIQFNNIIANDYLKNEKINYEDFNSDLSKKGKQRSLGVEKIDALNYINKNYFQDNLSLETVTYSKLDSQDANKIFTDVHDDKSAIIARIGPNNGIFSTSSGHYIAVVDYNSETNEVLVLDSAVSIDERNQSNRNGWVPLTEVTKNLNTSGNNLIILNKIIKDGVVYA